MFPKFVDWMAWVWYLPFNPPEVGALSCQFCRWLAIECDFLTSNTWGGCHLLIFTSDGSICQPSEGNDLSLSLGENVWMWLAWTLGWSTTHFVPLPWSVAFEVFVDITNLRYPDWRRIVRHFQVNCEYMLGCLQVQSVHCTDNDTFSSRTTDLSCNAPFSHLVQRILVAFSSSPGHHRHGPGNIIATLLLMVATGLSLPWILFH